MTDQLMGEDNLKTTTVEEEIDTKDSEVDKTMDEHGKKDANPAANKAQEAEAIESIENSGCTGKASINTDMMVDCLENLLSNE